MSTATSEQVFSVRGMDCAGCARSIEQGVAQLPGVTSCAITFTSEKLTVVGPVSRDTVVSRVEALGFQVAEPQSLTAAAAPAPTAPPNFWAYLWERPATRMALLGALCILPGLILHELLGWQAAWVDGFAIVALALAGWPVALSAWRALRTTRQITINLLMTIAALGAVVIGAYTEAGMVMVLFALGEALEGYTAGRARHAIRSLVELAPSTALRLTSQGEATHEEQVAVADLRIGDRLLVKPGERIPMDGRVLAGRSAVNQAPITGESRLIEKQPGDGLFAGSVNGEGALELEVTHLAADTTISRMITLVEQAQERRAPTQRFVDSFATWYTPAVVTIAALVAIVPPLLFGQPFWNPSPEQFGWLYRGLALLVVACPCALVISTPVSIISALSSAARNGILIKGGSALEALSSIRAIAFDKTGTLTLGQPSVVALRSATCTSSAEGDCAACEDLLALAQAVERRSEHPLALAIVQASAERGLATRYPAAEGVQALAGRGVQGQVAGRSVLIGSHSAFDLAIPHPASHCAAASADAALGRTPVLVMADQTYLGTIALADKIRPSSRAALEQLKQLGFKALIMLTGDNHATAQQVGEAVGVTDVRAELLPAEKLAMVEQLKQQHGGLAMIGDGINDTPALAAATVGIAIGGAAGGTAQAMETADITLMSDDLQRLPGLFRLSRATMATIYANVALSIAVKLVFLLLVLLGMGTLWMAVLADVGVSLLVTLNGMRLLRYRF